MNGLYYCWSHSRDTHCIVYYLYYEARCSLAIELQIKDACFEWMQSH